MVTLYMLLVFWANNLSLILFDVIIRHFHVDADIDGGTRATLGDARCLAGLYGDVRCVSLPKKGENFHNKSFVKFNFATPGHSALHCNMI